MTTQIGGPVFNVIAWCSGYVMAFFEWLTDVIAYFLDELNVDRASLFMPAVVRGR